MDTQAVDVKRTFVDVRRAFRLLQLYGTMVKDITDHICRQFDVGFYCRATNHCAGPPNSGTDIKGRWSWDFLPLYDVSLLYHPATLASRKNFVSNHHKGDWMLELRFQADASFDGEGCAGEPNPLDFNPPEQSESLLYVGLWYLDANFNDTNWYYGIWDQNDWPDGNGISEILVKNKIVGRQAQVMWHMDEILDREVMDAKIAEFKNVVAAKIGNPNW